MYAEAQKILQYLPIRRIEAENNYIEHLLGALRALDEGEDHVRGFAILPLHLLFLLAIQYKILRIATEQRERYSLSITLKNPKNGQEDILAPTSPFMLGFFGESELADLCKIVGLGKEGIRCIKELVRYRNDNLAHAKGYVESNPDDKVSEYLEVLSMLQQYLISMNDEMAKVWEEEMDPEDDLAEFVEIRLLGSYLCPADFESGLLKLKFTY